MEDPRISILGQKIPIPTNSYALGFWAILSVSVAWGLWVIVSHMSPAHVDQTVDHLVSFITNEPQTGKGFDPAQTSSVRL
jgi:hypothetical protein